MTKTVGREYALTQKKVRKNIEGTHLIIFSQQIVLLSLRLTQKFENEATIAE
jgi:hypothetical protein